MGLDVRSGKIQRNGFFIVRVRLCFIKARRYEMIQVLDDMMPEFKLCARKKGGKLGMVGKMIVSGERRENCLDVVLFWDTCLFFSFYFIYKANSYGYGL